MVELCILIIVFYLYLAILFGYHLYIEARSSSEYASPKWYARRPTAPTHNLCMAVVTALLALLTLLFLILCQGLSQPLVWGVGFALLFWAANSCYRFAEWRWDEYTRGTLLL